MKNCGIEITNGKIINVNNVEFNQTNWAFKNNDPQIHIRFTKPVYGIRVEYKIEEADFSESIATVYYKTLKEDFTEKNAYHFPISTERKIVREILFEFAEGVEEIRFDPAETGGECKIGYIRITPIVEEEIGNFNLKRCKKQREKGTLLFTHDTSLTGAPILASHISTHLKKRGFDVIVFSGTSKSEVLENNFKENEVPLIKLDQINSLEYAVVRVWPDGRQETIDRDEYQSILLKKLRKNGFTVAVTNTVVTGQYVDILKDYGYLIISLIHEMKTTILNYGLQGYGEKIAKYSDYVVFPNQYVKNDFLMTYPDIKGECLIRPQGVYLEETDEKREEDIREYGISASDIVIMSSGTCELRKGIDLFVNAAIMFLENNSERKIKFIWTGNFSSKELQCWILDQIERTGWGENITFVSFIKDTKKYRKLLKRADVFWALSREDPFPSSVLEAMKNRVPVVGFKHTGGIQEMLSVGRGILIDNFNLGQLVKQTEDLLCSEKTRLDLTEKAKKYVDALSFPEYVDYLIDLTERPLKVFPKLDLFIWEKDMHFYQQQLGGQTIKSRERQLKKAIIEEKISRKSIKDNSEIVLLDTAIGSDNVGDEIIMDYCLGVCKETFPEEKFVHIPTHIYTADAEDVKDNLKILCGTNLLYTHMEDSKQWALPKQIRNYNNICFLGVGMQQIGLELPISKYTKTFLKYVMTKKYLHSVRDEETKRKLNEIGIKNVLNTGCPTMWKLSEEYCKSIPVKKAPKVVTTITDYMMDSEKDVYLLKALKKYYNSVYIWIRGQLDYQYLKKIIDLDQYEIIPPSLECLDRVLKDEEVEYIGTRLHAGIRSMNMGNRSLIIGVDNRARAMKKDTNLPVIERSEIEELLEERIFQEWKTEIHLPMQAIKQWKGQFQ